MCHVDGERFEYERFLRDFGRSECYHPPLKLEAGNEGTFLETSFKWDNGRFRYWLKNENKVDEKPKIWRYADFRSHGPYEQKRALITSMMRKVDRNASDDEMRAASARQKLEEFRLLRYPRGLLRGVCNFMGATTGNGCWISVREAF